MERQYLYRRYDPKTDLDAVLELVAPEMKLLLPQLVLTPALLTAALDTDPWQEHMQEKSNRELVVMVHQQTGAIEAFMDGVLFPGARGVRVLLNGFIVRDSQAMDEMFGVLSMRCRGMGCGMLYLNGRFPLGLGWQGHPDCMLDTRRHLYDVGFNPEPPYYAVLRRDTLMDIQKDTQERWEQDAHSFTLTLRDGDEDVARCVVWRTPAWLRNTPYGQWGVIQQTQEINDRPGQGWGREAVARMMARLNREDIHTVINCVNTNKEAFWLESGFERMLSTKTLERPLPM